MLVILSYGPDPLNKLSAVLTFDNLNMVYKYNGSSNLLGYSNHRAVIEESVNNILASVKWENHFNRWFASNRERDINGYWSTLHPSLW